MITRLHSKYPVLANELLTESHTKLQKVVERALQIAIQRAGIDEHLSQAIINAFNNQSTLPSDLYVQLEQMRDEQDNSYLDAIDLPKAEQESHSAPSYRARALSALCLIMNGEDLDGQKATEIVYEVIFSGSNEDEVVESIKKMI